MLGEKNGLVIRTKSSRFGVEGRFGYFSDWDNLERNNKRKPLMLLQRGVISNSHFYKLTLAARWKMGRQGKHLGDSAGCILRQVELSQTRICGSEAGEQQMSSG